MLQMMGLPELTAEEMKFPGCSSDVDVFGGCKYTRKRKDHIPLAGTNCSQHFRTSLPAHDPHPGV